MKFLLTLIIGLTLFIGCGPRINHVQIVKKKLPLKPTQKPKKIKKSMPHKKVSSPPQKEIKLKEIDDSNHSDSYMYPEDTPEAKKDPVEETQVTQTETSGAMTKEACISMISQEKFDKYTAMFGSEAASIKRCAMLKAINQ